MCDSSATTFLEDLTEALVATGATLAFDAIGGGELAGQILGCMETAVNRAAKEYSRYGSSTHKQVYLYGWRPGHQPDHAQSQLRHGLGRRRLAAHALPAEDRIRGRAKLRERVVAELKTIFASHYTKELSLFEALSVDEIAVYGKRATGAKVPINPSKGIAS